ncbi:MAG TPA: TetR/AcrR family transcriptional regulator [Pseudonocardiaceae bacterium]
MHDGVKGDRTDARRERWRAHREHRRAELVDAAVAAIEKHGRHVGMDEIAAEAGVSKPVLYRHFADKNELYLAVAERATQLLIEHLMPTISLDDGTPNERIRAMVDAYLTQIESRPQLYHFLVSRSFADRPIDVDPVSTNETLVATRLARLLGDHMRAYGLDSGAAEPWAFALVGAVQTAGAWWMERQTMSRAALTEYLARIIWYSVDGVLRAGGVEVDPDQPLRLPRLRML